MNTFVYNLLYECDAYYTCIDAIAILVSKLCKCTDSLVYRDYITLSCQLNLVLFSQSIINYFFKLRLKLKLNTAFLSYVSFLPETVFCFALKLSTVFDKFDIINMKNILKLRILLPMYAVNKHFTCFFAQCRIQQYTYNTGKRYIKLLTIYQKPVENSFADANHRYFTKGNYLLTTLHYILYRGKLAIDSSTIAYLPEENTYCQSHYSYFTEVIGLLSAQPYSNYLQKTATYYLNKWQSLCISGLACHIILQKPDILVNKIYN